MAGDVTTGKLVVEVPAGRGPVAPGADYVFPVEVEVRTKLAAAELEQAVQLALASLASAVRSA